jgi:hypothetical protein
MPPLADLMGAHSQPPPDPSLLLEAICAAITFAALVWFVLAVAT